MSWWAIPSNPARREIEELRNEIFFPTKRSEDWEKLEWGKIPEWFFKLADVRYDVIYDIDYHLSWDTQQDELYFDRKLFQIDRLIHTEVVRRVNNSIVTCYGNECPWCTHCSNI